MNMKKYSIVAYCNAHDYNINRLAEVIISNVITVSEKASFIFEQWKPSYEATPFAPEKVAFQEVWPLIRGRNQYI